MSQIDENPSDAGLVQAIRAGDRDMYAVLVDRYLQDVYSVAARIVMNRADAEDVVQETFLRVFEQLQRYDVDRSFRSWVVTIAGNIAINHLRSRRRWRMLRVRLAEHRGAEQYDAQQADDLPNVSDWEHWLGQLNDAQRAAIVLFHFHEMPYAQVAEVMAVPVNTVRTLLHRGRRRLRELMTRELKLENVSWNVGKQNS